LIDGGAIVIVEKVLGDGSNVHDIMAEIYREKKRRSGYDDEQIERKRLALEGVLVPDSASTITNRLRDCNFREVDCFWRWLNFAAFIGIK
jgi:tRNA (cmo5U34)-methyltransferase